MVLTRLLVAATRPEERPDLDVEREPPTVGSDKTSTLGRYERIASAGLGFLLVRSGLRNRSFSGLLKAAVGGYLVFRGVRGRGRYRAADLGAAMSDRTGTSGEPIEVDRSITIDRPAEELSEMLHDPEQLSQIIGDAAVVTAVGEDMHRWTVRGPMDRTYTIETRLVTDEPGELLRWESTDDGPLSMDGAIRFDEAPADQGTEVQLQLRMEPPGGRLGAMAAERLDVVPETAAGSVLRRFKSLAETGEIPTLEDNPSGRGQGDMV